MLEANPQTIQTNPQTLQSTPPTKSLPNIGGVFRPDISPEASDKVPSDEPEGWKEFVTEHTTTGKPVPAPEKYQAFLQEEFTSNQGPKSAPADQVDRASETRRPTRIGPGPTKESHNAWEPITTTPPAETPDKPPRATETLEQRLLAELELLQKRGRAIIAELETLTDRVPVSTDPQEEKPVTPTISATPTTTPKESDTTPVEEDRTSWSEKLRKTPPVLTKGVGPAMKGLMAGDSSTTENLFEEQQIEASDYGWDSEELRWNVDTLIIGEKGGKYGIMLESYLKALQDLGVNKAMLQGPPAGKIFTQGLRNLYFGSDLSQAAQKTFTALSQPSLVSN